MKVYTKTGDDGTTSLFGGTRVPKHHLRIEAYGTVDELNVYAGLVADQPVNAGRKAFLKEIQDRLFTIGAIMAADPAKPALKKPDLHDSDIDVLESAMDDMDSSLPPLRHFVLPGGDQAVSFCHLARVVCRRAERLAVALAAQEALPPETVRYLNRLSDYFFVLSRKMAQELRVEENKWVPRG